jgi:hypothetical protein
LSNYENRKATEKDISIIIELIADDELGKLRENYKNPLPKEYFEVI